MSDLLPEMRRLGPDLIHEHAFIEPSDEIYCFYDYHAGRGREGGPGNALLYALKQEVAAAGRAAGRWANKTEAVERAAALVSAALAEMGGPGDVLVPTPPSTPKGTPGYDSRMTHVAWQARDAESQRIFVREFVEQTRPLGASHRARKRPSVKALTEAYAFVPASLGPPRGRLIVLDDLLTTGRHFRAMSQVLTSAFPEARIVGLFLARRVWEGPRPPAWVAQRDGARPQGARTGAAVPAKAAPAPMRKRIPRRPKPAPLSG